MKKRRNLKWDGHTLTIGQVAFLAEVSANTVKKWCEAGLVKFSRVPNGKCHSLHRRIDRLSFIEFAKVHGLEFVEGKLNELV